MSSSFEASSLNLRTEAAQVPVSTLGKMFRTLRPPKDSSETSARSLPTRVNPGASAPGCGNVPLTSIALPLSVTVDMRSASHRAHCRDRSTAVHRGQCSSVLAESYPPVPGTGSWPVPEHARSAPKAHPQHTRGAVTPTPSH